MLRRRALYLAALLGAAAFQIFNEAYLAHFILALVVTLPFLSLLLSLPAMLGAKIRIDGKNARRGEAASWQLSVSVPAKLPLARLTLALATKNRLTGRLQTRHLAICGLGQTQTLTLPADTSHCGQLVCAPRRVRVFDYLGLFSLRRTASAAALFVLPAPAPPDPLPEAACARENAPDPALRKSRTGEDYELRPYRPGDPMRLVHWKLSAKQDDLVVREMQADKVPTYVVSFDHFGPPEVLDRTLDRLSATARAILSRGGRLHILWAGADGAVREFPIAAPEQLDDCLAAALSSPASLTGPQTALRPKGLTGPILYCHIAAEQEDAPCENPPG